MKGHVGTSFGDNEEDLENQGKNKIKFQVWKIWQKLENSGKIREFDQTWNELGKNPGNFILLWDPMIFHVDFYTLPAI